MASNGSDVKYFTAEGIKKMEEELDYLRSVKRGEVAEKIKVARSFGDLSENAEYDEARKEQAFMEGRIQELGMNPKDYWWYCDLRRYGSCKHAGFGLGFERLVMYLTGVSNIRDVLPHPRTVGSADF